MSLSPLRTSRLSRLSIHTNAVASSISNLSVNPVLGHSPPEIAPSEKRLTRLQRTTLSQLRSGHCKLLNEYATRIGKSSTAICPECLIRRHTTKHLFQCDAVPTTFTVSDLWKNPVSVASFLQTLPSFSSLIPPASPPQPPPPPEPPP